MATVEVMNDRLCVASKGEEQRELSPQYPLSCYSAGTGCQVWPPLLFRHHRVLLD